MAGNKRIFRVFLSSTFNDFKLERQVFRNVVAPRLREVAGRSGADFQLVDLRWGISERDAKAHDTMRICQNEVLRSMEVSPRPNFVGLIGQRYGWRPLPPEIPEGLFRTLLDVLDEPQKTLLAEWYRRDANVLTRNFGKPGHIDARDIAFVLKDRATLPDADWPLVERRIGDAIATAYANSGCSDYRARVALTGSATEREILLGALGAADGRSHVTGFIREIIDLPTDDVLFQDPHASGDARARLDEIVRRMADQLGGPLDDGVGPLMRRRISLSDYSGGGDGNATSAYLADFSHRMISRLTTIIEAECASDDEAVTARPVQTGRQKLSSTWVDRPETLGSIERYVRGEARRSLVLTGPGGAGKTTVMRRLRDQVLSWLPEANVVAHFIGLQAASGNEADLIRQLCLDILKRAPEEIGPVVLAMLGHFRKANIAPIGRDGFVSIIEALERDEAAVLLRVLLSRPFSNPLVIIIDGVDQLCDQQPVSMLTWLPDLLGENLRLVLSVRSEALSSLRGDILPLPKMRRAQGEALLQQWLLAADRDLTEDQRSTLLDSFVLEGNPLYLRLAFEQARWWSERQSPPEYWPQDVRSMIDLLINSLRERHGAALVNRALALIAAARDGLSENEAQTILSRSPEVLREVRDRYPYSPEVTALPDILWSRLFWDAEPFLAEQSGDGHLLRFFHREIREAVLAQGAASGLSVASHEALRDHFGSKDQVGLAFLRRQVRELPFHLHALDDAAGFVGWASNLNNCMAGSDYLSGLMKDLVLLAPPASEGAVASIRSYYRMHFDRLRKRPDIAAALALAEPVGSSLRELAKATYVARSEPHLELVDSAGLRPDLTVSHGAPIVATCWAPDRRTFATVGADGSATIWNCDTGRPLAEPVRFATDGGEVTGATCRWNEVGLYISSGSSISLIRSDGTFVSATNPADLIGWDVVGTALVSATNVDISIFDAMKPDRCLWSGPAPWLHEAPASSSETDDGDDDLGLHCPDSAIETEHSVEIIPSSNGRRCLLIFLERSEYATAHDFYVLDLSTCSKPSLWLAGSELGWISGREPGWNDTGDTVAITFVPEDWHTECVLVVDAQQENGSARWLDLNGLPYEGFQSLSWSTDDPTRLGGYVEAPTPAGWSEPAASVCICAKTGEMTFSRFSDGESRSIAAKRVLPAELLSLARAKHDPAAVEVWAKASRPDPIDAVRRGSEPGHFTVTDGEDKWLATPQTHCKPTKAKSEYEESGDDVTLAVALESNGLAATASTGGGVITGVVVCVEDTHSPGGSWTAHPSFDNARLLMAAGRWEEGGELRSFLITARGQRLFGWDGLKREERKDRPSLFAKLGGRSPVTDVQLERPVHLLAAAPAGGLIAVIDESGGLTIGRYDGRNLKTGNTRSSLFRHRVRLLAFSPDAKRLAVADARGQLLIVGLDGLDSQGALVTERTDAVIAGPLLDMDWSPDGRHLVALRQSTGFLEIWSTASAPERVLSWPVHASSRCTAFGADGASVAVGSDLGLHVYEWNH